MKLFAATSHRDMWRKFLRRYPIHVYKKHEIIFLQNETPTHLNIVKSGIVKVYNINSRGEEHPVSFDAADDMFPIGWVFGKIDKTEYLYEALTDCELYELPRKDFLLYLKLHPKMSYDMYASLARKYVSLQARIYALEQSKAAEKITLTLLYLCERFATHEGGSAEVTKLKLPLTQQELANFIGITRETTSTELKKLEKLKIIKHQNHEYRINIKKLQKFAES